MARLPYLDSESASPAVAASLAAAPPLNIFRLVAHAETAFRPFLRYGAALLSDLALDQRLRELAILRVAALTPGAEYEWVQHASIAARVGASPEEIAAVRAGEGLTGDAALVVRFTEQVVRDATPDADTFEAFRERFSPRETIELLLVIGQYMTLARVMATAQIDIDEPTQLDQLVGPRKR